MESRVSPLLRPYLSLFILLPLQEEEGFQELRNMVYEVNRSQLAREDFLSDNIYLYRRDTGSIEIV